MQTIFTQEMKTELVDGLRRIFEDDIFQIILYGSVARETAAMDSDIDIAIILWTELDAQRREAFISWASDMDMKYECVFSIIDIEKGRFDEWGDILPFYKNIRKEGVTLWKAA